MFFGGGLNRRGAKQAKVAQRGEERDLFGLHVKARLSRQPALNLSLLVRPSILIILKDSFLNCGLNNNF